MKVPKFDAMDVNARKLSQVQRLLLIENEDALDEIDRILDRSIVVAHTVDGRPLNKQEYLDEVEEGCRDVEEGRTFSSDEVREEMKSWSRK